MIGQKQKIFGGGNGDCFRACVASILELPNDDRLPNVHDGYWILKWNEFLSQFGISVEFDATRIWREGYWIASVTSKNLAGSSHAIVMKDTDVAFDPSTRKRYHRGQSLLGSDVVNGGWWFEVQDVNLLHKLREYKRQNASKDQLADVI